MVTQRKLISLTGIMESETCVILLWFIRPVYLLLCSCNYFGHPWSNQNNCSVLLTVGNKFGHVHLLLKIAVIYCTIYLFIYA